MSRPPAERSALAAAAAVREGRMQAAVAQSIASQAALDRAGARRAAMHVQYRRVRLERTTAS